MIEQVIQQALKAGPEIAKASELQSKLASGEVYRIVGSERGLRDYFAAGGKAEQLIVKCDGKPVVFEVPQRFYELPTHEIKEILGRIEDQGAEIKIADEAKAVGISEERGVSQQESNESNEGESSRAKVIPRENGEWDGEVGNSVWRPDDDYVPQKFNPDQLTWKEIKEKYGIEGIPFKDGEPDFSMISEGTVEIGNFTKDRLSNFAQADQKFAEKFTNDGKDGKTWTAEDVREYRKENQLTWHERSDQKTLDLVPREVHGNIQHAGGIHAAKQKEVKE